MCERDPGSDATTSGHDVWSVVRRGRVSRAVSSSDAVRVSLAPHAVETGRSAVLAEESQSKRQSQATTIEAPGLEIADVLQYDLTRGDSDVGGPQQSESDTESIGHSCRAPRHRRLRLTWNVQGRASANHRDVRPVANLSQQLARRIGAVPVGGELPRAIRQQR